MIPIAIRTVRAMRAVAASPAAGRASSSLASAPMGTGLRIPTAMHTTPIDRFKVAIAAVAPAMPWAIARFTSTTGDGVMRANSE